MISLKLVACDKKHGLRCQEVNYRSVTVCDEVQKQSNIELPVTMMTLLTVFLSCFVWFCVQ